MRRYTSAITPNAHALHATGPTRAINESTLRVSAKGVVARTSSYDTSVSLTALVRDGVYRLP
jgi:hypothetical protein